MTDELRAAAECFIGNDIAMQDARYVMMWLLQVAEIRREEGYGTQIPTNIIELCERSLRILDDVLLREADSATPIHLSDEEIDRLVYMATKGNSNDRRTTRGG